MLSVQNERGTNNCRDSINAVPTLYCRAAFMLLLVYKQILELDPSYFQSIINIGSICFYRKMYLEAIDYYKKAIALENDNYAPYYNLGNVYAEIENFELALLNYEKALEICPEKADIYAAVGYLYQDVENYDKAILNYQKAIELDWQLGIPVMQADEKGIYELRPDGTKIYQKK